LAILKTDEQIRKMDVYDWKPYAGITSIVIGIAVFISNTFKNLFR
jgi:hypothetical protein